MISEKLKTIEKAMKLGLNPNESRNITSAGAESILKRFNNIYELEKSMIFLT